MKFEISQKLWLKRECTEVIQEVKIYAFDGEIVVIDFNHPECRFDTNDPEMRLLNSGRGLDRCFLTHGECVEYARRIDAMKNIRKTCRDLSNFFLYVPLSTEATTEEIEKVIREMRSLTRKESGKGD